MDAIFEFSPEEAWQAAVVNLESKVSRVAFNTWVKPVQLVGFDDDTFVIGCINPYGRDWMESRLTTTIRRFLTGIMNRQVKVQFVVVDQDPIEDDQDQEDDTDKTIDLDIHYHSIRNILLEPGRVVRLPVYNLRWLPYVGSQIIFLVMALWQEYYLASGGKTNKGKCKVSVRAERVCQWAGISRAQFFRLFQSDNRMMWFARKIETAHELNQRTGRIKKSSNKYDLVDSPLTPGDAEDLKSYLLAHGIQKTPFLTLQGAVKADPKEILHYPVRLPPGDFDTMTPRYLTVQQVIRELVGHPLDEQLGSLTDQLADRLLAQGEFILVSWYFLKNWLPLLGADAAMFVLILRNLCYFNDEIGEIRDVVWMNGGYEAIANRLGIKNPRVVAHWLPARLQRGKRKEEWSERTAEEFSRRHRLQGLLSLFVERIDHRMNSEGIYGWKFKVQRVDPLTPQHLAIQQAVSSLLAKSEDQGVLSELHSWISHIGKDCTQLPRSEHVGLEPDPSWHETVKMMPLEFPETKCSATVVFGISSLTKDCSETLKDILKDCFETLDLEAKDCFETLLKILKSFKDSQKDKETPTPQDSLISPDDKTSQSVVAVTDAKGFWLLESLLARADRKNRKALLDQEKDALPFVSWLIYGSSQPSIQNPYSLAIAKLKENTGISAGGACERLAALPPRELTRLIEQALLFYPLSDRNWRMLFLGAKRDRILLLADSLGLVLDIEEESKQPSM